MDDDQAHACCISGLIAAPIPHGAKAVDAPVGNGITGIVDDQHGLLFRKPVQTPTLSGLALFLLEQSNHRQGRIVEIVPSVARVT